MAPRTSVTKLDYSDPKPFVLPVIEQRLQNVFTGALSFLNNFLPRILIPREGLNYSSKILEEIMKTITDEFRLRGLDSPEWKKYQGDGSNSQYVAITFTNPTAEGNNLANQPVEVFPLIVQDIQEKIETLINDPTVPDTLGGYMARIFANNTIINNSSVWKNVTKLPSTVAYHAKDGTVKTFNPLSNAQAGNWAVSVSVIEDTVNVMGVSTTDPTVQNANISTKAGEIEVTDPNFPQSPYGESPSGVPGTKGIKMTSENLTVWNRINAANSSLGVGAGREDRDMGYGYLANIGHTIHQLRYQPPSIETFPTNVAINQYASNIFSNTTPNLPWVLSLPVETQIGPQNWGFWLIKGNVGVVNNSAHIRAFNNPSAQVGGRGVCPFSVFFPPPIANCSCGTGDSAYFIWHSQTSGFTWNQLNLIQTGRAQPRFFGRNTRLRINGSITGQAGTGDIGLGTFFVGVRTVRISNVNLQPFHNIIIFDIGDQSPEAASHGATSLDVNIMSRLNRILGGAYRIGGLDAIEAISLLVKTRGTANWTCQAVDGEGGRSLPESCRSIKTCSAGDMTATISSVEIYEPNLVGDPVSAYT